MKLRFFYRIRLSLFAMLAIAGLFSGSASAKDVLTLGIHPYKSPAKLIKAYTPLAEYLAKKIGMPVHITISKDYQTHIEAIGTDQLDIAYMGPASYVSLQKHYGERPLLARQQIHGKSTFQGKIIARNDSPLQSLAELKGKSFAFGDPSSTMSHLVPRYMLWKAGVGVEQLARHKFLGSHDNVALAVLTGEYTAGAVKEAVFYKYQKRGLKALSTTPALSEHLFVASKTLDPAIVDKLRKALYSLSDAPNGIAIMSSIKPDMTAMVPVKDADYDNLREILRALKQIGVME